MRFNDNEALPKVAYRHWSEIVKGVAVEPSYMMALRLRTIGSDCLKENNVSTQTDKDFEIKSALASTHSLLSDALLIRGGSSNMHINSFRELLSKAKELNNNKQSYYEYFYLNC